MLLAVIYEVCWSPNILYIFNISRNITNKSLRIKTKLSIRLLLREEAPQECLTSILLYIYGPFACCLFSILYT